MKKRCIILLAMLCLLLLAAIPAHAERVQVTPSTDSANPTILEKEKIEYVVNVDSLDQTYWFSFTTGDLTGWMHVKTKNYSLYSYDTVSFFGGGVITKLYGPFGEAIDSSQTYNISQDATTNYITQKLESNTEYKLSVSFDSVNDLGVFSLMLSEDIDSVGDCGDIRADAYNMPAGTKVTAYRLNGWGDVDYFIIEPSAVERNAVFYLKNIEFDSDDFKMQLEDSFSIPIACKTCYEGQEEYITATLQPNETYYLSIMVDSNHQWFGDYLFGWCASNAHTPGETKTTSPTCQQDGQMSFTCSICGEEYDKVTLPKTAHQPSESWVVKSNATCTKNGEKEQRCTVCNEIVATEEILATGHQPGEEKVVVEATCITNGKKAIHCTICNEELSSETIKMVAHTQGKMEEVSPATCVENGRYEQRCTVCNALISTEDISAYGHKSSEWKTVKEPTCTEVGTKQQVCMVCNAVLDTEEIPADGHKAGKWVDVLAATCTAEGYRAQHCSECNIVLSTEIALAHGHSPAELSITREATCLQSGLKEKKCSTCGMVLQSEQLPALGHTYTTWEIVMEATREQEGEQRRNCINCGDTMYEVIPRLKILGIF